MSKAERKEEGVYTQGGVFIGVRNTDPDKKGMGLQPGMYSIEPQPGRTDEYGEYYLGDLGVRVRDFNDERGVVVVGTDASKMGRVLVVSVDQKVGVLRIVRPDGGGRVTATARKGQYIIVEPPGIRCQKRFVIYPNNRVAKKRLTYSTFVVKKNEEEMYLTSAGERVFKEGLESAFVFEERRDAERKCRSRDDTVEEVRHSDTICQT